MLWIFSHFITKNRVLENSLTSLLKCIGILPKHYINSIHLCICMFCRNPFLKFKPNEFSKVLYPICFVIISVHKPAKPKTFFKWVVRMQYKSKISLLEILKKVKWRWYRQRRWQYDDDSSSDFKYLMSKRYWETKRTWPIGNI